LPGASGGAPAPDPGADGPVYFLLHIPKTAGQTIQVHLARHCAPGMFWQSRRTLRPARRAEPGELPDLRQARVISGHHIGRSMEALFAGREIRRIVLLRDPLELQISLYNWQMMDNLAKGLGTYGFALHRRALPRDFIAHFLLSRWLEIPWRALLATTEAKKHEMLNRMLAGFWFVGGHADCDRLIEVLGRDLGIPPVAPRRNSSAELQGRTGWRLLTAEDLPASARQAFRAHNRLDQALWQDWRRAGFAAASVRPQPGHSGQSSGFLGHELVRPWCLLGRFAGQGWASWRRPGCGPVVSRGDRARDLGQWELAARHYRQALQAMPNAAAIWVQYGHALKESGNIAEAEAAYRRSLVLSPDIADTHLQLGHALKLQGRLGEAAASYLRAAVLDPARDDPRDELIGLGWTMARIEETLAAGVRAIERVEECQNLVIPGRRRRPRPRNP
jgi:tetratricopeptide (TPR) repeat protein